MTSKYSASIKVRLTRVFNIAVLTGVIILAALVSVLVVVFEHYLKEITKDELRSLIEFGT